jgi:two-component system, OmpR family, phosphate regulon response regulator OmpR
MSFVAAGFLHALAALHAERRPIVHPSEALIETTAVAAVPAVPAIGADRRSRQEDGKRAEQADDQGLFHDRHVRRVSPARKPRFVIVCKVCSHKRPVAASIRAMNEAPDRSRKILVVDDDLRLRQLLDRYLREQGFLVKAVDGAEAMDKALARELYDLVVLDLMMPGEDGLSICRRLRGEKNDVAIIMLTAKGDDVDRIVGLELGADDYLAKPFNPRELVARIHAVLRRRVPPPPPGTPAEADAKVSLGETLIDLGTRELTRDGVTTTLTTGEFALLKVLVEHPRKPLSRDKLMELARGREYDVFDRSIDVQVSRLRKLVEEDPAKPRYIQTVWGFGYVFVPDGNKHTA